jgi:hypothetical protein
MSRPRALVSSTVADFGDLRSALKFWLEELQYEALLSEYNDFEKRLDVDSYTACLQTVDTVDYFILLIGARRGGWYDESQRISITRAEYQRAYKRFQETGRPKILTFVRRNVLDVRQDRKAIAAKVSDDARRVVETAESLFIQDPEATFAFIDEVRRNEEMKEAVAHGGERPPGNWYHTFSDFRDIVDVLRREFRMWRSLRRSALAANLRHELLANLAGMLGKSKSGALHPLHLYAAAGHMDFRGAPDEDSTYTQKTLSGVLMFLMFARVHARLSVHALDEAIRSTEFMEWDAGQHAFRVGPLQRSLLSLRGEIDRIANVESLTTLAANKDLTAAMLSKPRNTRVANMTMAPVFSLVNAHINVVRLLCTICLALDGDESAVTDVKLKPSSPFPDQVEGLAEETPTIEDASRFLAERGRGGV